jgi:predicted DNA-binding transcriptional regulator AlpA
MAGPILRLKDLMLHTGLSRSAIYDRMDKNSPRYAEDFPKSFSLSGSAIGWCKNEVDAWLEACAANAKSGTPSKKIKSPLKSCTLPAQASSTPCERAVAQKQVQNPSRQPTSTPENSAPQSSTKPTPRLRNLADDIVQGGRINARLFHYVRLKSWTPAMGALLISGIEPPLGCIDIPVGGVGLDEKPLHGGDERFQKARSILSEWNLWPADAGNQSVEIEPSRFFLWCIEQDINSEWLRLIFELTGCIDEDAVNLTASRFALLTGRSS